MAKVTGKSEKAAKTGSKVTIDEDIEESEDEEQQTPKIEESEQEQTAQASAQPTPKIAPVIPKVKKDADEPVQIAVYVDVDPAPMVGHPAYGGYNFLDHGVAKLEARKNYVVPRKVAEHLIDKKVASLVS